MAKDILLPRGYLSYTQISLWNSSKDRYIREYFLNAPKLNTPALRYGKSIARLIESGEHRKILPNLKVYEKSEYEIDIEIRGVRVKMYLDSYNNDPENPKLREYKTGIVKWTQEKVLKHKQLVMYALGIKHKTGKIPEVHLDWIVTEKNNIGDSFWEKVDGDRHTTGEIKEFKRIIHERELIEMENEIERVAVEISESYKNYININL